MDEESVKSAPETAGATLPPGLATLVSVLAALAGACGDDVPGWPTDRTWHSAHFRYFSAADDDQVCPAVLDQLERHFALVQGHLHFPWAEGALVDYVKFRDQAAFERAAQCPAGSQGCSGPAGVRTSQVLHAHELVHAYLGPLGSPPPFFQEGIAVALACERPLAVSALPWREVVTLRPFDRSQRIYEEGPWFVGYLLRRFGPSAFLDLYLALRDHMTADAIAATFADVYGVSLDQAWTDAARAGSTVPCALLWECAGQAVVDDDAQVSGGAPIALPIRHACDGSDQFPVIELDAERDLVVNRQEGLNGYQVAACDGATAIPVGGEDVVLFTTVARVPAGTYFLTRADRYAPERAQIGVVIPPAPALSAECATSAPLDVDTPLFPGGRFEVSIPDDGRSWFMKMRMPSWSDYPPRLNATWPPGMRVEHCPSCDTTACEQLTTSSFPAADDDGGVLTLRLSALSPGAGRPRALFIK
jgi:hypothetical protein